MMLPINLPCIVQLNGQESFPKKPKVESNLYLGFTYEIFFWEESSL